MTKAQAKREIDSLDFYLQNHTDDYGEESHTAMMMAIQALEQEPKTGHWIVCADRWGDGVNTIYGYKCSECGCFDPGHYNYCPDCGAKMESEE